MSDYDVIDLYRLKTATGDFHDRGVIRGAIEEIQRLRAELIAARDEAERLRGRVATVTSLADALADGITKDLQADNAWEQREADGKVFTAHEDYLVFRENSPDTESQAWLLRKQAEVFEKAADELGRNSLEWAWQAKQELLYRANRLRQQANELEKPNG